MLQDELLAQADAEIRQLCTELSEVREELERANKALALLADENAALYRRARSLEPPPAEQPLAGLRIGIIGHPSREADYRLVIERHGGQLLFAGARDKLGQIDRVVQKAHGTIFLTSWGSHKASQRAMDAAIRYEREFLLCDQPGLARVERMVLDELLPLIRPD